MRNKIAFTVRLLALMGTFCAVGRVLADTLKIDLLHNYAFSEGEGVWYGDEAWKVAMLEDDGLYTNEGDVPWVFEHGAKFYQNGNICIAVTGCGSEKIVPVITLGTASAADNLSATVLTDAEFAAKLHIAEYDFEQDDDEFVYEDYAARIGCYYPASAWTNGSVVEGRQWILVSLKDVNIGPDGFFSPKTFAVGIEGTDQKTPVITLCPTDKLPNETTFTPSNVFGLDIMMNGYPNANSEHCSFDPFFELWYGDGDGRVPYVFDVGDPYEDGGDSVRNLTVSVPSGGELYLKMETEYLGGHNTWNGELDCLQISGSAYGGNVRTVGSAWSGPYGSYWVVLTAKSAGDLVIELGDFEKFIVNGIWFRPSSVNEAQCLATEAWYRGSTTVANGRSMSKYLGFVTGSGVIAFGEKATLVCYPNEGEELDHWEFVNCTAPADATINNRVLTFTVSKSLYDEIPDTQEPLKRIIVRPVFRLAGQGGGQSKYIVAFDANGGELDESEASREVVNGDAIGELPTTTREGYVFDGWWTAADGGEQVISDTLVSGDATYYAHWRLIGAIKIVLHKNDGTGMEHVFTGENDKDCILPGGAKDLKWAPRRGFKFMGWSVDEKSKVVKFKDKENVKAALNAGETLDVYAIWQLDSANAYAIQYIRNDGSGMVRTIGFIGGEARALNSVSALGFARRGYTFGGWAKSTEDARNKKAWLPDKGIVRQPIRNGQLLRVYAIWTLTPGYYTIRFNKNDGSGAWRELGYEYGKNTTLPTIENGLGWGRPGYTFVGWRTKSEIDRGGTKIWLKDKGVTKTPIAAGKTLSIYAIWEKNSESAVEEPAVCTGKDCASAGTAVAEAKLVEALVYFADGEAFAVEASVAYDGWTVVEPDGAVYCGYIENGVGELAGASGDVLFVATALK